MNLLTASIIKESTSRGGDDEMMMMIWIVAKNSDAEELASNKGVELNQSGFIELLRVQ